MQLDRLAGRWSALITSIPWRSSRLVSAKMLRDVVVDDQHLAAEQRLVASRAASRASAAWPAADRRPTRCRNSAVSSSSRSGDCTPLSTMLLRHCCAARASSSCSRSSPGEHHDRHVAQRGICADLRRAARTRACPAGAGRARRSRSWPLAQLRRAPRARCRPRRSRCRRGRAARRCSCRSRGVVLDHQQLRSRAASTNVLMRSSARFQSRRWSAACCMNENAPRSSPCWRSSSTVTICTGMCRVSRIVLQLVQHRPAEHVGQEDVER